MLIDTVIIRCDRCYLEQVAEAGEAPSEFRSRLAERDGWVHSFDRDDGQDRCGNCSDRR